MNNVVLIGRLEAMDEDLADSLRDDGIDVFSTDDTQLGISEGLSRGPALAFVEVDSPASDNFEAVSQLRREGDPSCRIVAVCNRYSPHVEKVCTALGADFTIPQTDDRSSLLLLIRGLLWLDRGVRRQEVWNEDSPDDDDAAGERVRRVPFRPIRRQPAAQVAAAY